MLTLEHCNVFYGEIQALYDASLEVNEGEIVAIIGANGAGKTTTMKSIMNTAKRGSGNWIFCGENINTLETALIVRKGISYLPEGRELFPSMSVMENLEMGAVYKKYSKAELDNKIEEVFTMFPRLKERRKQQARLLSGGEQQMVVIARGLMSEPKLLLCDEPSLGLAPILVAETFDILARINAEKKIPILIVEQNAYMALTISSRCYVLENGVIAASGNSKELIVSDKIRKAYLGV